MTERKPKKMGRREIPVDDKTKKQIEDLAALQLPVTAISSIVKISERTLNRRFADLMNLGRDRAKAAVSQVLFEHAVNKKDKQVAMYLGDRLIFKPGADTQVNLNLNTEAPEAERIIYKVNWADEGTSEDT